MDYKIDEFIVSDESVSQRIKEGIEKNRKGNFSLCVDGCDSVHVKLKKHKFRFGCNLFMLDEFPDDKNKNEIYKQKFADVFNLATLPFYWDATEPQEGKTRYDRQAAPMYRRPPIDLCIDFCKKHGIEPREHALCYDKFFPEWIKGQSIDFIKKHLEIRMKEISTRYKDLIPTIEVTNEMQWDKGETAFYNDPSYMEYCFKLAEKYFPHNELVINEWGAIWEQNGLPWDTYWQTIDNVLLKGGRIDAVGMQYHMFFNENDYFRRTRKFYNLKHLFKILDNYALFGKPIQITEITIPALTEKPEDELLQADIIERLYSLWFSYPNIEQIIYWNLVDGYAAFTTPGDMKGGENVYRGGLLRFDLSEKPSYQRIKHLIQEVWVTDEDVPVINGKADFRGFYGEYEVTVNGKTHTVSLSEDAVVKRL